MKLIDLTGQRFGRLIARQYQGGRLWLCKCDCGNTATVKYHNLRPLKTKSCGCLANERFRRRSDMFAAYRLHQGGAAKRGIDFLFSYEEWSGWWLIDDRWSNRGRLANQFVMARNGDTGPYAPWNVHLATATGNHREAKTTAKPVMSPAGWFPSLSACAKHHGIRPGAVHRLIKGRVGWDYDATNAGKTDFTSQSIIDYLDH